MCTATQTENAPNSQLHTGGDLTLLNNYYSSTKQQINNYDNTNELEFIKKQQQNHLNNELQEPFLTQSENHQAATKCYNKHNKFSVPYNHIDINSNSGAKANKKSNKINENSIDIDDNDNDNENEDNHYQATKQLFMHEMNAGNNYNNYDSMKQQAVRYQRQPSPVCQTTNLDDESIDNHDHALGTQNQDGTVSIIIVDPDTRPPLPNGKQQKSGTTYQAISHLSSNIVVTLKVIAIFSTLYFFMWSSSILSQAFNLMSHRYIGHFMRTSDFLKNPIIGLMVGVITTVLFQSSGAVTSVLVTIVGSGLLTVRQSIPIIMGANLGTSVTNTVVSLIVYRKKTNFEIAMTAGIVHDMYNMMSVVFILPLEMLFHPLEKVSQWMLTLFDNTQTEIGGQIQFLNYLVKPLVDLFIIIDDDKTKDLNPNTIIPSNVSLVKKCCKYERNENGIVCARKCFSLFSHIDISDNLTCFLLTVIAMATLFSCLIFVVKVTKSLLGGKLLNWVAKLAKTECNNPCSRVSKGYVFILVGLIITVMLHSSGVFTSMLVPLAGGDVLSLMQIYELTIGSNVGTTTTGIMAALSANSIYPAATLQVALCHFLFNVAGILMFYVFPYTNLPIWASKKYGMLSAKNMWFSIAYLVIVFLVAPTLTLLLYYMF